MDCWISFDQSIDEADKNKISLKLREEAFLEGPHRLFISFH